MEPENNFKVELMVSGQQYITIYQILIIIKKLQLLEAREGHGLFVLSLVSGVLDQ